MTELPTGTVTFLYTDIEGSTSLAQQQHRHHQFIKQTTSAASRLPVHNSTKMLSTRRGRQAAR